MKTVYFTGTVSHATMRSQDLIPAFLGVLREFHPGAHHAILSDIPADALEDHEHEWWKSDDCSWILNEDIWSAMEEIAPEGHYFGAHPGDGSDYGFWSCEEF